MRLLVPIIAVVAVVDQVLKELVLQTVNPARPVEVIGEWARIVLVFNSGAAFSMGQNHTWVFTTLQLGFVLGALYFGRSMVHRPQIIGVALIAGGALGNLIDRLFRAPGFFVGHVVDYISIGNFAVFNLADSAITIGVVVVIAALFFEPEPSKEKA
ncbi:Lipoprotein signal peptidase [Corynebacterium ciconiae DSM 44920]|uniref:signal peptidase II n=1 Tax=Corynebacterium ciconiae TaxID=227319 RepID=UPI0003A4680D|nr:signal peptidase II [Corynebacterium ciconiae]WKD60801.1 Lipoprotein signal peptidase [Corynebacterium ciconiae DSM 44920]